MEAATTAPLAGGFIDRISRSPSAVVMDGARKLVDEETGNPSMVEVIVDSRFALPKCELPPQKDMEVVSLFVSKAVREQHQNTDELSVPVEGYRAIGDAIRLQKDLSLLRKVLIALRTSALQYLTADTTKHARLIHLIVRFVPFPNSTMKTMLNSDPLDETVDDFDLADAHLNLLTALVTANSLYVVPAMTALWKMLTFRITNCHTER